MGISGTLKTLLLLTAASLLAGPSIANPGGGGGGAGGSGSTPGMSMPDYDPAVEYRKGIEALQAERWQDAKKALDRVLSVAPRDANTNFLAGLANAGLGDLKSARKHYEKAVKADKDLVQARRELGVTHLRLGDRPKAEAELAGLKAQQAKCGGSCAKAAEIDAAIEALTAALGSAPQARLERPLIFASVAAGDHFYLDAVALINERRYDAAIDALRASQEAFGPHPDILTYLGFAHRKLGRYDVAEAYYQAALAAAPDHRGATEYYGELMVERGDLAGASAMLARLERNCDFGCAEADELRRWIEAGRSSAS
jgi:tetratricopeptide (TPR) repeat protein